MQIESAPRQKVIPPHVQQFLKDHPADSQNLINMYDSLSPMQQKQGRNWYPSANLVAHEIAKVATKNTGRNVTADQVAGHMANYSGQTQWHNNIHAAFLAAHGIYPGEHGAGWRSPIDGKGFMASGSQAEVSKRINSGEDWRQLLSPVKEGSFGQNISSGAQGGANAENDLQSRGGRLHLTTDRHHVSAAHGAYANEDVYKALGLDRHDNYDKYTDLTVDAANKINARDPKAAPIHPVSLQAMVWLGQQAANAAGGYNKPGAAERSIRSAASNKARLEGVMTQHGLDHLNEKAPVVGFPGTGGAIALDHDGDIPVTQTYHGMPAPNGQPMTTEPTPEFSKSPNQHFVQQQNAMNKALIQAGQKPLTVKQIPFDPKHGGGTVNDYLALGQQHGGYDSSHVQASSGQEFPHFHDTPQGQKALQALSAAGMPTPNRDTNMVDKIPAAPAKVAAWVRTASRPKKNFVYDPIAEQYKTSKLDAKFSCNCGKTFAPSGFNRCACGQSWASFTIGSQDKTAAKAILVVRQVSEHRDRVLAKKAEMISDPEDQQYNRANSSEQHPEREQTESFDNEYTEGVKPHEGDPFYVRNTESDPAPVVLDKEASMTPPFVREAIAAPAPQKKVKINPYKPWDHLDQPQTIPDEHSADPVPAKIDPYNPWGHLDQKTPSRVQGKKTMAFNEEDYRNGWLHAEANNALPKVASRDFLLGYSDNLKEIVADRAPGWDTVAPAFAKPEPGVNPTMSDYTDATPKTDDGEYHQVRKELGDKIDRDNAAGQSRDDQGNGINRPTLDLEGWKGKSSSFDLSQVHTAALAREIARRSGVEKF